MTPTESRLAALWRDLFATVVESPATDYFDAGGDSLIVLQLIAQIESRFGVHLPPRTVFETPTLGGLAARIDSESQSARSLSSVDRGTQRDTGPSQV